MNKSNTSSQNDIGLILTPTFIMYLGKEPSHFPLHKLVIQMYVTLLWHYLGKRLHIPIPCGVWYLECGHWRVRRVWMVQGKSDKSFFSSTPSPGPENTLLDRKHFHKIALDELP